MRRPSAGAPKTVKENVEMLHSMVFNDPWITVKFVAEICSFSDSQKISPIKHHQHVPSRVSFPLYIHVNIHVVVLLKRNRFAAIAYCQIHLFIFS